MLDHIGFNVSDFAVGRRFFAAALAPLGTGGVEEGVGWALLGRDGIGALWFGAYGPAASPIHFAHTASGPEPVQAFHEAALGAGG